MNSSHYKAGAIIALITVVTTLGIHSFIVGPATFEEALSVYQTTYYIFTKFWVIIHCIAVMASMFIFCKYLKSRGSVFSDLGVIFYAGFGLTEILRMSMVLGYLGQLRSSYLAASDEMVRQILKVEMDSFNGIGQGMFLTFFICFILGNLITGCCCLPLKGLFRVVGIVLLIWAVVGIILLTNEFLGISSIGTFGSYFSVIFQPLARGLIALALFRAAGFAFKRNFEGSSSTMA